MPPKRSKMGGDEFFRRKKGFEDIFVLISIGGSTFLKKKSHATETIKNGGRRVFSKKKGI
jgi:hypothetical protein